MLLVSVIVRSMDRSVLSDALDSIAQQTYPQIEVIVVNAKGAEHRDLGLWCGRYPLRLVGTGERLRRGRAANVGLEEARGTYLTFLDDDDLLAPSHIQSLVAALESPAGNCRAAYIGIAVLDDQGICIDTYNRPSAYRTLFGSNCFPIHAVMFHRSLLSDGCRFDENLEVFEDWDFWTQVADRTTFAHVDQIGGFYRAALGTSGIAYGGNAEQIRTGRELVYEKWRTQWTGKKINSWVENLLDLIRQGDEWGRENALLSTRIADQDAEANRRNEFIAQLTERIAEQGAEADRRNEFIAQLTERVAEQGAEAAQRDAYITQLTERIAVHGAEASQRDAFIAQLKERIAEQGAEASQRDAYIAQLTARLTEQDTEAKQRDAYIAEVTAHIAGQDAAAVRRNELIAHLEERVCLQNKEGEARVELIAHLSARIAEQDRDATRRDAVIAQQAAYAVELDRLIAQKAERISALALEKQARIDELVQANDLLANSRRQLQEAESLLAEKEGEVAAICGTRSWKITRPLRWLWSNFRAARERLAAALVATLQVRNDLFDIDVPIAEARSGNAPQLRYPHFENELAHLLALYREDTQTIARLDEVVDIVVPVYDGMEYLPRFFDSLIRNTSSGYRLIVVDDCSRDARVLPFLQEIQRQVPAMRLLRNRANLGFVGTVNRAFRYTRNHFVLLNTDVEVPPFWLERLLRPLIQNPLVASVTPFTNSGTICSFPVFCQDNELLEDLSVDQIDSVFAGLHTDTAAVELPTGVGFCMAINRRVAMEIGFFDAKTFGRGYGEENDWCLRAKQHGYENVMAPNLFVYHKHGGSFTSEEKNRLIELNLSLLGERYPFYSSLVADFIGVDPVEHLRNLVLMLVLCKYAANKAVLIFDHDIGGGANHYRNRLIGERLEGNQPVLLFSENLYSANSCKLRFYYKEVRAEFAMASRDVLIDLCRLIPLGELFYNDAVSFADAAEVPRLLTLLHQRHGAKLTIAFHDFYPVCPSYTLLNDRREFCRLPSIVDCRNCLPKNCNEFPPADVTIDEWRAAWGEAIAVADTLLFFSESTLSLVKRVYPMDAAQVVLCPHALDYIPLKKPRIDFSGELHIGVVGAINVQKGLELVIRMGEIIQERSLPVRIFVIGIVNSSSYPESITVTGSFNQIELPEIFEKLGINMGFLPSIWPETFSYVTSEMIGMGVPLCCFDLGAPVERVRAYHLGRVIEHIDAESALRAMSEFLDELRLGDAEKTSQPEEVAAETRTTQ